MICSQCGVDKDGTQEFFYLRNGLPRNPCKDCKNIRSRKWYSENRNRHRDMTKSWLERNKERASAYYANYRVENRDKCLKATSEWASKNRAYLNEREKKRIKEDAKYRLTRNVRTAISKMLSGSQGSSRHLPYSVDELKDHLERQFVDGMTWDNYGSFWHVDHIVPVAAFPIIGPDCDGFRACWALSNLRPLKAEENLSKGARRTYLI